MRALRARVDAWRRAGGERVGRGRRIYVHRRYGGGPLVVLLHGFPSCSYDWRALLERRPDWNVLTFDFLGFGLSEKPRDHLYSLAGQADLVEDLLLAEAEDVPV